VHRVGVLGSGVHLTFEYIHRAFEAGAVPGCAFAVAVANHPDVPLFAAAGRLGIPSAYLDGRTPAELDAQALRHFHEHDVEFVILLGYGKKIGAVLLDAYPDSILNIHAAPLPRFGGPGMIQPHAQAHVLAAGVRFSGPTIHLVDAEYDHGQILAHWPVRVRPGDTPESLNDRCNTAAMPLYVQALKDFVYRLDHPEQA
jgi:phosphoribosylglycinamide formyltransferase-1